MNTDNPMKHRTSGGRLYREAFGVRRARAALDVVCELELNHAHERITSNIQSCTQKLGRLNLGPFRNPCSSAKSAKSAVKKSEQKRQARELTADYSDYTDGKQQSQQ